MSKNGEGKTKQLKHKHGKILGVRVDSTSTSSVLTKMASFLSSGHPELAEGSQKGRFYIVTPNPEIILKAQEDPSLKTILNKANISIPDGVGLKIFGDSNLNIIHGRKLMLDICTLASDRGYKVFLLGSRNESNTKATQNLKKLYPNLKIESKPGAKYDNEANPVSQVDLKIHFDTIEKINNFAPDIIFVAFGCPKQEKWISKYLPVVKARMAMTVGGALDYISGEAKIPPKWMEALELETLWRLFTQRGRFKRIFNAVVVFPLYMFADSLKNS